ncbi:hypothetical protein DPMN_175104 [Dreissena polymorpha]|uniref:Uncharacterized protein n=1 Tax=Dreissena polymorpha TaxID=45954 RepID=A0A9D4IFQ9_DREPO|nr:hypothetical protein DPMN_175104 [Dreissena polymorpha]
MAAEQKRLVYADIDIAFLEMKQKKVTKKNNNVHAEYTSIRELISDVSESMSILIHKTVLPSSMTSC